VCRRLCSGRYDGCAFPLCSCQRGVPPMRIPLRLLPILLCSLALPGFGWADEPAKKPSRVDAQGDALPEGALARLGTIRFRAGNYFSASALSPDGKLLALSDGTAMRLLDAATGKVTRNFRTNGGSFSWLTFPPDGKLLAASNYGSRIQLWDVATGNATQQPGPSGQNRMAHLFTFSGDSKYIAAATENYGQGKPAAYVWDVGSGKLVSEIEPIHTNNVHIALSNDGKILATTGIFYDRMGGGGPAQFEKNKIIQLWDVPKGKELKKLLSEDAYTTNLAFSPDGKHLTTVGSNSMLAI